MRPLFKCGSSCVSLTSLWAMKHNQEALQQVFLHRESCFLICLYKVNEKLNVDLNQQGNKSLRNRHLTRLCPSSRGLYLSAPWDAGQEKYYVHHMMLRCFFAETGGRCWFLIMHMVTVQTILFILIKCRSTEVLYTPVLLRICSPVVLRQCRHPFNLCA